VPAKRVITQGERERLYRHFVDNPESSFRSLGQMFGMSQVTAKKILVEMGVNFDEASKVRGRRAGQLTEEVKETAALKRARMADLLIDDAFRLRERAWSQYEQIVVTRDGPAKIELAMPPLREQFDAYKALDVALERSRRLLEQDSSQGAADDVSRWLAALVDRK
jgi:hypothetical protein